MATPSQKQSQFPDTHLGEVTSETVRKRMLR